MALMSPGPARGRRRVPETRERLLKAAAELFAERGYDRATVRDIAARAGVDASTISRYFGGKAQLYIEVAHGESGSESTLDLLDPADLKKVLERSLTTAPGPIHQVAVRPHEDPEAQAAVRAELHQRVVAPLQRRFADEGRDAPELLGEVVAAAAIGVLLGRASGAFDHLPDADNEQLHRILTDLLTPRP